MIKTIVEHVKTLTVDPTPDIIYPVIVFAALFLCGFVALRSRKGN
jgi:hypothetical protein